MKFCHNCGYHLTLGTEKFCPECGINLKSDVAINNEGSGSSTGSNSLTTVTNINGTSGDVIGSAISGTGNIIGKEVAYSVQGSVINLQLSSISAEILQELKNIVSKPVQLETKDFQLEQTHKISPELTEAKANEAKVTKEETSQVLKDLDQIDKEKGIHIEQIRVGEVQVSRTELTLRDIILEGNEHFYKGEYSKAIGCFDKALEIDEKDVNALNNKGVAFDKLGKYDEAIQCHDKALEIDGKYVEAWYNKGNTLDNLSRYDEAIECYDKALEIDDKYAKAWNNKGLTLDKL